MAFAKVLGKICVDRSTKITGTNLWSLQSVTYFQVEKKNNWTVFKKKFNLFMCSYMDLPVKIKCSLKSKHIAYLSFMVLIDSTDWLSLTWLAKLDMNYLNELTSRTILFKALPHETSFLIIIDFYWITLMVKTFSFRSIYYCFIPVILHSNELFNCPVLLKSIRKASKID